jgi:hypothetical protein
MSVTVNWIDPNHTITLIKVEGSWTVVDALRAAMRWREMLSEVHYPVANIMDFSGSQHVPDDLLPNFPVLARNFTHPNDAGAYIITKPGILERFIQAYANVYESHRCVNSIEEAIQLIETEPPKDKASNLTWINLPG